MQQTAKGKESEQESDIKSFDENKHSFQPNHKDSADFSPTTRVTPITKSPPHPALNPTEHCIQLQIQVKY